jgi:hypothetical protein
MYMENDYGSPPSQSDLAGWADYFGMTFPVVSDPGGNLYDQIWAAGYTPVNALLAPGMQVVTTDWVDDAQIEAVLP